MAYEWNARKILAEMIVHYDTRESLFSMEYLMDIHHLHSPTGCYYDHKLCKVIVNLVLMEVRKMAPTRGFVLSNKWGKGWYLSKTLLQVVEHEESQSHPVTHMVSQTQHAYTRLETQYHNTLVQWQNEPDPRMKKVLYVELRRAEANMVEEEIRLDVFKEMEMANV